MDCQFQDRSYDRSSTLSVCSSSSSMELCLYQGSPLVKAVTLCRICRSDDGEHQLQTKSARLNSKNGVRFSLRSLTPELVSSDRLGTSLVVPKVCTKMSTGIHSHSCLAEKLLGEAQLAEPSVNCAVVFTLLLSGMAALNMNTCSFGLAANCPSASARRS